MSFQLHMDYSRYLVNKDCHIFHKDLIWTPDHTGLNSVCRDIVHLDHKALERQKHMDSLRFC